MEYKLRTFCQIAEKLGSEKIIIEYVNNESINMEDFNYVFSYTNVPENSIFS